MEINTGLLIFLFIFVILPLIQRVLGGGAKGQPPPARRPGPHARIPPEQMRGRGPLAKQPGGEAQDRTATEERRPATDAERAAELIPADLWEILTGERRAPTPPPRAPVPDIEEWEDDIDEAWDSEDALVPVRQDDDYAASDESQQRQDDDDRWSKPWEPEPALSESPAVARPVPPSVTVSPVRPPPPAFVQIESTATRPHRMMPSLANRSDLMRAVVLQEVLGRPRGLE